MKKLLILLFFLSSPAYSHELTPAYFKLVPSHIEGLVTVKMTMFNKRQDVEFYEIDVYDNDWNPIRFASQDKIIKIEYLDRASFEIFLRYKDSIKATYICTTSKLKTENIKNTAIASRVCSKIK